MDDLIAWLRATWDARARELDEDERVARAATQAPWWHNPGKVWLGAEAFEAYDRSKGEEFVGYGESPFSGCIAATGPASHAQAMADAQHIARWDPKRVLREVATERTDLDAKRQMLAHIGMVVLSPGREALPAEYVAQMEWFLRLLALPYAGRDGWREEWTA